MENNTKKTVSQNEIDKLHPNDKISLANEIQNTIVLLRNELNIVEKDIESFDERRQKKIRRALKKVIAKIFAIRQ